MTNVSPPAPAAPGFVLKGWHVGLIVVAFFAAVIAVDVSMAIRAYSTFPGEVTAKPYEEGIGFNGEIHRRAAARALGWKARLADRRDGTALVGDRDPVRLNAPQWLWQSWTESYGEAATRAILRQRRPASSSFNASVA